MVDIEGIVARVTEEVYKQLRDTVPQVPAGDLAGSIEHSLLNPDTPEEAIKKGCEDAKKYGFANVCVSPYYTSMAAEILRGSGVGLCVPVGFPHGAASTRAKCAEIREAIMNGATELDLSMMIVAIRSGDYGAVEKDLYEMVSTAGSRAKVKAIYEQGLLTDEEKERSLKIAVKCGVDFIKISNALTGKKAIPDDVRYVRRIIGQGIGIKIDGGISDAQTVRELMAAGAQRFGCSKSVQIMGG